MTESLGGHLLLAFTFFCSFRHSRSCRFHLSEFVFLALFSVLCPSICQGSSKTCRGSYHLCLQFFLISQPSQSSASLLCVCLVIRLSLTSQAQRWWQWLSPWQDLAVHTWIQAWCRRCVGVGRSSTVAFIQKSFCTSHSHRDDTQWDLAVISFQKMPFETQQI